MAQLYSHRWWLYRPLWGWLCSCSDLYDALKGQEYPAVRFALSGAEVQGRPDAEGWADLRAWGTLVLAGASIALYLAFGFLT